MIEKFQKIYKNRHEYAKRWKETTKGKVIGYFCTYAPEELMYAAGILPVRILGSHEPEDVTGPHIHGMYCPFCRDVLAQGLKGRYDYLDGIMISQSCLHVRQSFNSWKKHVPVDYAYYLYMPNHVQNNNARPYLREELREFKNSLEAWMGKEITEAALKEAIEVYNTNRRLLREIYELRKDKNPPITGLEAMYLVASSQMSDKKEHNDMLAKLKEYLPSRPVREPGVRLLIVGSENDDTGVIELLEDLGTTVVIDEHCVGSRYFWNEVIPNSDLLQAIANRYIDRPRCPTKDYERRDRLSFIMTLAKEYSVQGAIILQQKFCDPHECDIPTIRKTLEEAGIPTYFLELDVTVPYGQFKIRLEAFLEMLHADELFV